MNYVSPELLEYWNRIYYEPKVKQPDAYTARLSAMTVRTLGNEPPSSNRESREPWVTA